MNGFGFGRTRSNKKKGQKGSRMRYHPERPGDPAPFIAGPASHEPLPPLQPTAYSPFPTPEPESGIVVSAVLSIHNRSKLFRRALDGYLWQTLPPENWEIILLDDMSTEEMRDTYRHLAGKVNLRHVLIDHTRHSLFKERNPGWKIGDPQNWFHTPALTMNVGFRMARGRVICLCHPEILHAPANFALAAERLKTEREFIFGTTYLGTRNTNLWLDQNPSWNAFGWDGFLDTSGGRQLTRFQSNELYWYTSFLPRDACWAVRGVDFEYLNGVAGEDDDFRDRVRIAGWTPVMDDRIQGLHQDHSDETEPHRQRDTEKWNLALERNRALYQNRKQKGFPFISNTAFDWTAMETVVGVIEHKVGSVSGSII